DPGAAPPVSAQSRLGARGDGPVGDEAAEVVEPREVDELERAAEALDPPAVALRARHGPAVGRIAPELAGAAVAVGRRAGHEPPAEEFRARGEVGALVRDVDRQVAEDAHAPGRCIAPQRRPLALEPHLALQRATTFKRLPLARPVRVARDEVLDLV